MKAECTSQFSFIKISQHPAKIILFFANTPPKIPPDFHHKHHPQIPPPNPKIPDSPLLCPALSDYHRRKYPPPNTPGPRNPAPGTRLILFISVIANHKSLTTPSQLKQQNNPIPILLIIKFTQLPPINHNNTLHQHTTPLIRAGSCRPGLLCQHITQQR